MFDPKVEAIRAKILALIADLLPHASLREMYGGVVIELEPGNPKTRIGGVFAYEAHVSLELTHGASLPDPQGVLEGGGKARRHIKLRSLQDIEGKGCAEFLTAAAVV